MTREIEYEAHPVQQSGQQCVEYVERSDDRTLPIVALHAPLNGGRPLALDLFCSAGGSAMGMYRAGFDVIGVDIKFQKNYPSFHDAPYAKHFRFVQADALCPPFGLSRFDFIWASPPCQAFTIAGRNNRRDGVMYQDLVDATRQMLIASGCEWVIENVPGAPLRADIILCGSQFDLPIARHRLFELSFPAFQLLPSCSHAKDLITICGHGTPSWMRRRRIARGLNPNASIALKHEGDGHQLDELRRTQPSDSACIRALCRPRRAAASRSSLGRLRAVMRGTMEQRLWAKIDKQRRTHSGATP